MSQTSELQTQKLNFSQRNGLEDVKNLLQMDAENRDLRFDLGEFCLQKISWHNSLSIQRKWKFGDFFRELGFTDEFYENDKKIKDFFISDLDLSQKEAQLHEAAYGKVCDFIEFLYKQEKDDDEKSKFEKDVNSIFEKNNSSYRLTKGLINLGDKKIKGFRLQ